MDIRVIIIRFAQEINCLFTYAPPIFPGCFRRSSRTVEVSPDIFRCLQNTCMLAEATQKSPSASSLDTPIHNSQRSYPDSPGVLLFQYLSENESLSFFDTVLHSLAPSLHNYGSPGFSI